MICIIWAIIGGTVTERVDVLFLFCEYNTCLCLFFICLMLFVGLSYDVAYAMIRWVYTDKLELGPDKDQDFVVKLLAAADKYQLMGLKLR